MISKVLDLSMSQRGKLASNRLMDTLGTMNI